MANNELLKASIRSAIKANGNEEITGDILQQTLVAIVDALGKGYQFMGGATPTTDPGTPDQKVCYLAMQQGVYPNFYDLEVGNNEIAIMMYDSQWQGITITMGDKQDKIDYNLQTNSKEIVGAINEVYNGGVKDKSITSEKIADKAVTEDKLASQSVSSRTIKDATIGTSKLGVNSVTEAKIANDLRNKVNNNVKTIVQALTDTQKAQARKNIGIPDYVAFDGVRQLESAIGDVVKYVSVFDNIIDVGADVIKVDSSILEIDFCGATLETQYGIKGHARCKIKNLTIKMLSGAHTNRDAIEGFGYVENVYVTTEKDGTHKIGRGFRNCDHLFNCKVDGITDEDVDGAVVGFSYCNYLFQCRYSGVATARLCIGFEHCNFISQCYMSYGYADSTFKYSLGTNKHVESLIGISYNGDIPVFETFADTSHIRIGDYSLDNFIKLISSSGGTGKTKLYAKPDDKPGMATVLMDTSAVNWAVARRTATGTLKVKDAVEEDDTVTKKQLDTLKTEVTQHLEVVTIYTDNTPEHMQANLDNIAAYEANLQALGVVDTPIGVIIPIRTYETALTGYIQQGPDAHRNGFAVYTENTVCYEISVRGDGYYRQFVLAYQTSVDAKVDKSLNAKSLTVVNLIGTDTDRLNALKSFETNWLSLIGDEENPYGKRFIGNWEDSYGYHQGLFIQDGGYNGFCYNCIGFYGGNALGQYSNKPFLARLDSLTGKLEAADMLSHLEAIAIKTGNTTSDRVDNKAAIQAYVDNLKALGVDMTKGYTIPVYIDGIGSGFLGKTGDNIIYYMGVINSYDSSSFGIAVDAAGGYSSYKLQTETNNSLTTTSKQIIGAINEVNTLAKAVKAFGAIELKASDDTANKAALTAYLKILTDAGVSTTNGYAVPVRITGNSQEYHGMLNIGTGVLLSGVVTDVNENHHYPFNVSTTDGVITFDESNYFLEKTSNEVTEMLDAIKYSHTSVPFTDTTLSNKAQLEVFLSKVPEATVMHCTYKEIWAGTLHKINGDWYGLLVKNTNSPADNINIKLSADGTVITSNSAQ